MTDSVENSAQPEPRDVVWARLLAEVATLPNLPGVYRYFDAQDDLLYVGKARDLKRRVSSYFRKNHGGTRIGHMVSRIVRMETTVVRSEAEALLLETTSSRHSIRGSTSSFGTTRLSVPQDRDPRVPSDCLLPGAVDRKHRYFGPYPNAWAVKETIQLLQKVFPLAHL